MKISVFGLGYVGCISAVCLAKEGHDVIGVDSNPVKVDMVNQGLSPIIEKDIDKIILDVTKPHGGEPKRLNATTDAARAVMDSEISILCVGTPSNDNGSLKLDYLKRCARDIGVGLKQKNSYHVIVVRSTALPGTLEEVVIKEIEYVSWKKVGSDFGAVVNPEFLREGTSVHDFLNPPFTLIGEYDKKSGDMIEEMYNFLKAPLIRTEIKVAEMIKYASNSFHALKVSFANEIGNICKAIGIDSHSVMSIFCMDNKLNLSEYYLKPGFAFGGSCLPKDLRALIYKAKAIDVNVPLLQSIIESNRNHIERTISKIVKFGKKKIGLLGLSFKAGTDDLRESPLVMLVEALIGKGFDIKIFDKNVSIAKLSGANREYIIKEIPHISSLMSNEIDEVIRHSEVVVIGNGDEELKQIFKKCPEKKIIFDFVRITSNLKDVPDGYEGICW